MSREERDYFAAQIDSLRPCKVGDFNVTVKFEMQLTMVDGKVANALMETLKHKPATLWCDTKRNK